MDYTEAAREFVYNTIKGLEDQIFDLVYEIARIRGDNIINLYDMKQAINSVLESYLSEE